MRYLTLLAALTLAPASFAQGTPPDTARYVSTFPEHPVSQFEEMEGTDLVMVYLTSQHCYWSAQPELKAAVDRAKVLLQARAEAAGQRFSAVGVVSDWDWDQAASFLSEAGHFDEIIAGRNNFTTGYTAYCLIEEGCHTATPMIRVFERDVTFQQTESGAYKPVYGEAEYLTTVSGGRSPEESPSDIRAWVAAGAPLSGWAPE